VYKLFPPSLRDCKRLDCPHTFLGTKGQKGSTAPSHVGYEVPEMPSRLLEEEEN